MPTEASVECETRGGVKKKASPDTRSLDIFALEYTLSRHNVQNDHSHSTYVIQVCTNLSTFQTSLGGKNLWLLSVKASAALLERS